MALKKVRIGANPDVFQFDDGDYSEAVDTDGMPIKTGTATDPNHAVQLSQVPSLSAYISSDAVIGDNKVARGDGGGRKLQTSGVEIDDSDNVTIPGILKIQTIKSGATQAAAGAAAGELWMTNGHASLPDNVVMMGV